MDRLSMKDFDISCNWKDDTAYKILRYIHWAQSKLQSPLPAPGKLRTVLTKQSFSAMRLDPSSSPPPPWLPPRPLRLLHFLNALRHAWRLNTVSFHFWPLDFTRSTQGMRTPFAFIPTGSPRTRKPTSNGKLMTGSISVFWKSHPIHGSSSSSLSARITVKNSKCSWTTSSWTRYQRRTSILSH